MRGIGTQQHSEEGLGRAPNPTNGSSVQGKVAFLLGSREVVGEVRERRGTAWKRGRLGGVDWVGNDGETGWSGWMAR